MFLISTFCLALSAQISPDWNDLKRWVEIPTVTGNHEAASAMASEIQKLFPSRALHTVIWDPSQSALSIRENELRDYPTKRVLLVSHWDVVDSRTQFQVSEVSIPSLRRTPFGSEVWQGPGVADAKGPLWQMIRLKNALRRDARYAHVLQSLSFDYFIAGDEEIGSPQSRSTLEKMAETADLALVFEPGWYDPVHRVARAPYSSGFNSHFQITIQGRSDHIVTDARVDHASAALSRVLKEVENLSRPGVKANVFHIEMKSAPNRRAEGATVHVAVRTETELDLSIFRTRLAQLNEVAQAQRWTLQISETPKWKEAEITPPSLQNIWAQAHREAGLKVPVPTVSLAVSAARFLAERGVPTIDSVGPLGMNLHAPDESLSVLSCAMTMKRTGEFLKAWLRDPSPRFRLH
jgi:acetylornithine deacetylase/succinyl-diaminopimelate desuccinylase-like protein